MVRRVASRVLLNVIIATVTLTLVNVLGVKTDIEVQNVEKVRIAVQWNSSCNLCNLILISSLCLPLIVISNLTTNPVIWSSAVFFLPVKMATLDLNVNLRYLIPLVACFGKSLRNASKCYLNICFYFCNASSQPVHKSLIILGKLLGV